MIFFPVATARTSADPGLCAGRSRAGSGGWALIRGIVASLALLCLGLAPAAAEEDVETLRIVYFTQEVERDALAQYLIWKKWRKWFLVVGRRDEDRLFAAAVRRAAGRFGGKIVAEKVWEYGPDARRTAQAEMPVFTQGIDYDVLIVADEIGEFGEYLIYRTWEPRLVAGTQGLVPTMWHRTHEQWGGWQLQRRFHKLVGRWMTPLDHAVWAAVRVIGEAATRAQSTAFDKVAAYLRGPEFALAAFKGVALSFRPWNGQLRQPVLLAAPRTLVSVSPQRGFLHQYTELDTLGYDRPESGCELD